MVDETLPIFLDNEECENNLQYLKKYHVSKCNVKGNHNFAECWYYHPNAKVNDRRRPCIVNGRLAYWATPCSCKKINCTKAHNDVEFFYHPANFRVQYCKEGKGCPRGENCAQAHTAFELRAPILSSKYREKTQSFVLAKHKTEFCKIKSQHDRACCVFYHFPTDRRRPGSNYSSTPCLFYLEFSDKNEQCECPDGDSCRFCHNEIEKNYHSDYYKMVYCTNYLEKKTCPLGKACNKAHSEDDCRVPSIENIYAQCKTPDSLMAFFMYAYKMLPCVFQHMKHDHAKCMYYHGRDRRRRLGPPDQEPLYSSEECSYSNNCKNVNCKEAHRLEIYYHPERYKVQACNPSLQSCLKERCMFYHDDSEIRLYDDKPRPSHDEILKICECILIKPILGQPLSSQPKLRSKQSTEGSVTSIEAPTPLLPAIKALSVPPKPATIAPWAHLSPKLQKSSKSDPIPMAGEVVRIPKTMNEVRVGQELQWVRIRVAEGLRLNAARDLLVNCSADKAILLVETNEMADVLKLLKPEKSLKHVFLYTSKDSVDYKDFLEPAEPLLHPGNYESLVQSQTRKVVCITDSNDWPRDLQDCLLLVDIRVPPIPIDVYLQFSGIYREDKGKGILLVTLWPSSMYPPPKRPYHETGFKAVSLMSQLFPSFCGSVKESGNENTQSIHVEPSKTVDLKDVCEQLRNTESSLQRKGMSSELLIELYDDEKKSRSQINIKDHHDPQPLCQMSDINNHESLRYNLNRQLGTGNSIVYEGVYTDSLRRQIPCAVKILKHTDVVSEKNALQYFNNRHMPHVVAYLDIVSNPISGTYALAMEKAWASLDQILPKRITGNEIVPGTIKVMKHKYFDLEDLGKKNELARCVLCKQLFCNNRNYASRLWDREKKAPRCIHKYHTECLTNALQGNEFFDCFCQKWWHDAKYNPGQQPLIRRPPPCNQCERGREAAVFCKDCDQYLCEFHDEKMPSHCKQKEDHKRNKLEQAASDNNSHTFLRVLVPTPESIMLLKHLLKGLEEMHSNVPPIIHRDLKPPNLLLVEVPPASLKTIAGCVHNMLLKIGDLGLAKAQQRTVDQWSAKNLGTDNWRAPEASDGRYLKESDIFSAGMIAFYFITEGTHPYTTEDGTVGGHNMTLVDQLRTVNGGILCEAHDMIKAMMHRDPARRPSASQCLQHPFFWPPRFRMRLLHEVLIMYKVAKRNHSKYTTLLTILNDKATLTSVLGDRNWMEAIHPALQNNLCTFRAKQHKEKYGNTMEDLLIGLHNLLKHISEMDLGTTVDPNIPTDEVYLEDYIRQIFPRLFLELCSAVKADNEACTNLLSHDFSKVQRYFEKHVF